MFSQLFPKTTFVNYPNNIGGTRDVKEVINILRRFRFIDKFSDVKNYRSYYVKTGETPDIVSSKIYGDSEFYWLLMVFNEMTDPFRDWPRDGLDINNTTLAIKFDSISFVPTGQTLNELYPFTVGDIITRCDSVGNIDVANKYTSTVSSVRRELFGIDLDIKNSIGSRLREGDYFGILNNRGDINRVQQVSLLQTPYSRIDTFRTSSGRILSPFTDRTGIDTTDEHILDPTNTTTFTNLSTTLAYRYVLNPNNVDVRSYSRSKIFDIETGIDLKRKIKIFPPELRFAAYEEAAKLLKQLPSAGRRRAVKTGNTSNLSVL
jgi:hypothetical protein